jgi:sulfur relay (sulfurtransferase) complex TusBCD TusD component (DsrE family)
MICRGDMRMITVEMCKQCSKNKGIYDSHILCQRIEYTLAIPLEDNMIDLVCPDKLK